MQNYLIFTQSHTDVTLCCLQSLKFPHCCNKITDCTNTLPLSIFTVNNFVASWEYDGKRLIMFSGFVQKSGTLPWTISLLCFESVGWSSTIDERSINGFDYGFFGCRDGGWGVGRPDRREMNCSASITLHGLSLKGVICCVVLRSVCVCLKHVVGSDMCQSVCFHAMWRPVVLKQERDCFANRKLIFIIKHFFLYWKDCVEHVLGFKICKSVFLCDFCPIFLFFIIMIFFTFFFFLHIHVF